MITNERLDNVYPIDVKMFGFSGWCSAYLVVGREKVALIDTGPATSTDAVRTAILKYGFDLKEITHILITHIHFDHCGSAGILLKEMPEARVFVHPKVVKHLIDPSILMKNIQVVGDKLATRFGKLLPLPASRVQGFSDGEVIDLGNGERLKVIFTPGHTNSNVTIVEEKNNGIFVDDTPGIYLAQEEALLIPTPFGSDLRQTLKSLKMLMEIPSKRLLFGHFGTCDTPEEILKIAFERAERYLTLASEIMERTKSSENLFSHIVEVNSSALALVQERRDGLYEYLIEELLPMWAKGFANYYMKQKER
jgi:glyoxylase-like metal-dependent hydrolase (beta-lactamase superfamily II)